MVRNALTGGAVAGVGLVLAALWIVTVTFPIAVTVAWLYGWITFEVAVLTLLLFAIYVTGAD